MNLRMFVISSVMASCTWALAATHATYPQWTGVWQGQLDGQPGVTLTLAEDGGQLSGTVVFNVVIKENGKARVAGSSVHAVRQPNMSGETLVFHVTRESDGRDLAMRVELQAADKARMQCENCGGDSLAAELVRSH